MESIRVRGSDGYGRTEGEEKGEAKVEVAGLFLRGPIREKGLSENDEVQERDR